MSRNFRLDLINLLKYHQISAMIGAVRITRDRSPGESRPLAGFFLPHSFLGNGTSASREVERA